MRVRTVFTIILAYVISVIPQIISNRIESNRIARVSPVSTQIQQLHGIILSRHQNAPVTRCGKLLTTRHHHYSAGVTCAGARRAYILVLLCLLQCRPCKSTENLHRSVASHARCNYLIELNLAVTFRWPSFTGNCDF